MKKTTLEEILSACPAGDYRSQVDFIMNLIEEDRIRPVRNSPTNGKKPALHTRYTVVEEKKDHSALLHELDFDLDARIDVDFYKHHLQTYELERGDVWRLSEYLRKNASELACPMSCNERSFAVWGREKFLLGGDGRKILRHCGLDMTVLNVYPTCEPFAYFAHTRRVPQTILILENKDPFFSMRKHLLEGHETVLGEEIGTLIYGAGKRVISSFSELSISAEPYMLEKGNRFLYAGDLDYEGIGIYENLVSTMRHTAADLTILPFGPAYRAMLEKGEKVSLPATKEQQNRNISDIFFC